LTSSGAVDGVRDGYPGDYTKEWATTGELAGAWILLTPAAQVSVSRIVLYDRPNLVDHILAGQIEFDDGTVVPVGELPNDGTALEVRFPAKVIPWFRFRVTNAVGADIGLSEIEFYM
jgi:hypothetical protein